MCFHKSYQALSFLLFHLICQQPRTGTMPGQLQKHGPLGLYGFKMYHNSTTATGAIINSPQCIKSSHIQTACTLNLLHIHSRQINRFKLHTQIPVVFSSQKQLIVSYGLSAWHSTMLRQSELSELPQQLHSWIQHRTQNPQDLRSKAVKCTKTYKDYSLFILLYHVGNYRSH